MPQKSCVSDLHLPDAPIHELLAADIRRHGDNIAMVDGGDSNKCMSYADVLSHSKTLSAALHVNGLRKGDVVSVVLPNCLQYPIIHMAIWQRGAICTSVNSLYTEYELHHHLQDSKASIVFTTDDHLQNVINVDRSLGGQIKQIIIVQKEPREMQYSFSKAVTFDAYMKFGRNAKDIPRVHIDTKKDIALMPYSSGTTGLPKAVELTHYGLGSMLHIFKDGRWLLLPQKGDTTPIFLPIFHLFGFIVLHVSLAMGVRLVVMEKFHKDTFLSTLQFYKVKHIYVVPPVLIVLAKDPSVAQYDISHLTSILAAAAPIGQDISEELMRRHPNIKYLIQAYGMTEIGVSHVMPPTPKDKLKHGSCGMLTANFECKIAEIGSGRELGPNQQGELWIKSPCVMAGYFNKPDATLETIDAEGWLHTGDIGHFDADGHYFVVDRLKELIKVKGFQVAPAELEDVLLSHESIDDAMVIGIPDARSGELPRAYVVLNANTTDSHDVIRQNIHGFVNEKVAAYKHLDGGIEFVTEIPKSPSGKLLRRLMREHYTKIVMLKQHHSSPNRSNL